MSTRRNSDEETILESSLKAEALARAWEVWVYVWMARHVKDVLERKSPGTSVNSAVWLAELVGMGEVYNRRMKQEAESTMTRAAVMGDVWAAEEAARAGVTFTGYIETPKLYEIVARNQQELARELFTPPADLYLKTRSNGLQNVSQYFEQLIDMARQKRDLNYSPIDVGREVVQGLREADGLRIIRGGRSYELEYYTRFQVQGRWSQEVNDLNVEVAQMVGMDGVEVSAHAFCAPDHLPYQGKVYSLKQFQRINDNLERPIAEGYNCRHILLPCHADDRPSLSRSILDRYAKQSTETITIGGKEMTGYEGTQWQRRQEKLIRRDKREAKTCEALGLTDDANAYRTKARHRTAYYVKESEQAGLRTHVDWTTAGELR